MAAPEAVCCFCHAAALAADPAVRLVPVSLRHRAFAHGPCLRAHCALPCEWCAAAPWGVGEHVLATVPWQGAQQSFPAEVVAVHPNGPNGSEDVFLTLSFADGAELERVAGLYPTLAALKAPPPPNPPAALAAALYERGLAWALGLTPGLPGGRDRAQTVSLWERAAQLGHPVAAVCARVPRQCVAPRCSFHRSPAVQAWWRLLPASVLRDALDVRPEEVLDGLVGGSLADAAAAPDPVGRTHAAADALVGAFAATLRGLCAPEPTPGQLLSPAAATSSSSSSASGGEREATEALAWRTFLEAHLSTFDRSVAELPGAGRPRAAQMARLAELQTQLVAKQTELRGALTAAKAKAAEHRWAVSRGKPGAETEERQMGTLRG